MMKYAVKIPFSAKKGKWSEFVSFIRCRDFGKKTNSWTDGRFSHLGLIVGWFFSLHGYRDQVSWVRGPEVNKEVL